MQQLLTGKKRLPGFNEKWRFAKLENVSKYSASAASFKTYESHLGVARTLYTMQAGASETLISMKMNSLIFLL